MYKIHGLFALSIGLIILLWGPIEFRGFPIDRWVGVLIILLGTIVLGVEFYKRNK